MSRLHVVTRPRYESRRVEGQPSGSNLDSRSYRRVSLIVLALIALAAVYFAVTGQWYDAAALGVLAILGLAFVAAHERLPSIFTLLFVLAGLVNAGGYVFDLWKSPAWFDETVHAFTSFTVMAAIGWMLLARTSLNAAGKSARLALAVAGLGLVLGGVREVFEWIIGIIGSPTDTMIDLVMDMIGAVAAGLFCAWAADRRCGERN